MAKMGITVGIRKPKKKKKIGVTLGIRKETKLYVPKRRNRVA